MPTPHLPTGLRPPGCCSGSAGSPAAPGAQEEAGSRLRTPNFAGGVPARGGQQAGRGGPDSLSSQRDTALPRPGAPGLGSTRWPEQGPGPPQGQQAAATHVGVPVSKDLVEDVAELPAEDGAAGKRQTDGIGPESKGPFLVMSAQNDAYQSQGQAQEADSSAGQVGGARGDPETHPTAAARPPASLHVRPRSPRAMVFSRGQGQGQGHAP